MIEHLLTGNMFISQLLTMGLPLIDESLQKLVDAMRDAPTNGIQSSIAAMARSIGACIALGVGSYECWMMILGRRGMDVIKILRIVIISICLTGTGMTAIKSMCDAPGLALGNATKAAAFNANKQVAEKEKALAKLQSAYIDSLRSAQSKLAEQKAARDAADEAAAEQSAGGGVAGAINRGIEYVKNGLENLGTSFENMAKNAAIMTETTIAEILNDLIRFIGEVFFQMTYYGMLLGQTIFMNVLWLFMPVAFAMSLAPPYRSAWSQWLSKYLSLSLWPFLVYLILYYVDFLLLFYLEQDMTAYKGLMKQTAASNTWSSVGALGIQAIGTTCMYVVGLLAGSKILAMVPEVCSWLIPGGVSSGLGQASAGVSAAAGAAAGSAVGTAATVATMGGGAALRAGTQGISGAISGASTGASMGAAAGKGNAYGSSAGKVVGGIIGAVGGGVANAAGSMAHDAKNAVSQAGGKRIKDAWSRGKG